MDDDFETETIPGRPLRGIDLAVLGAQFMADVMGAAENAADNFVQLVAQHANYLVNRDRFHEQAALEIETMIRGSE